MNSKKIAFILCVNDETEYAECKYYLDRLHIPDGYETDVVTIQEAPSMAAGYHAGMQSTDAKYKVYLHQDVFIRNRNFIADLLGVFASDKRIGVVGIVGARDLGADAYAIGEWDSGSILDNCDPLPPLPPYEGHWLEVQAVDGCLLATQYDLSWREDVFDGWDFYDISQCMEFKRAGYRVAVPFQKEPWCYHDCVYNDRKGYDAYRKKFLNEYRDMGDFQIRELNWSVLDQEKGEIRKQVAGLFLAGKISELREIFRESKGQELFFLREYELILQIDSLEEKHSSAKRFLDCPFRAEQSLYRLRLLKYALKRIEYDADELGDQQAFLQAHFSVYAVRETLERYVRYKEQVYRKLSHFFLQQDHTVPTLKWIYTGLKSDYRNYAFYYMLGLALKERNIDQAYLCMENAEFYCQDAADKNIIQQEKEALRQHREFSVRPVSIVILSYNIREICIRCIESIRRNNHPDTYRIIVVDNASSDGIYEWLLQQPDLVLIRNEENVGFPKGSNQGIKAAGDNDILLLNNDVEIQPNSIFCLRMGLYESAQVGAAGSVTNYAGNGQSVQKEGYSIEDWRNYAIKCNVPCQNPYENKIYLGGFSLLLRHGIIEQIGMFDERFSPGYYEDTDLGLRLAKAGYRQRLCKNSFVIHYGSASFHPNDKIRQLRVNKQKMLDKWGFDIEYYSFVQKAMIALIDDSPDAPIHVLEVGCGCGATLARIDSLWPYAVVKGVESVSEVVEIGRSIADILQGDIERMELPYEKESFDCILFGDVLEHLREPERTLQRLFPYLKRDGCIIASISNVMHMSVVLGLLKGDVKYQEAGILDKTHLRFFTRDTAFALFEQNGFQVNREIRVLDDRFMETDRALADQVLHMSGIADTGLFRVMQFVIRAVRKN